VRRVGGMLDVCFRSHRADAGASSSRDRGAVFTASASIVHAAASRQFGEVLAVPGCLQTTQRHRGPSFACEIGRQDAAQRPRDITAICKPAPQAAGEGR
jgi:hypothetical protein